MTKRAPQALICLGAFHVPSWASTARDEVRRGMWNKLRWQGKNGQTSSLKGTRWALLKNIQDPTDEQKATMASIPVKKKGLYRAYLLKAQLRYVFEAKDERGRQVLAGWLAWAKRSRLPEFTKLAKTIEKYKPTILTTLDHGLSNGRIEATNTHLRALTRRSYGFHSPEAPIAMAFLTRGGLCPNPPGSAG